MALISFQIIIKKKPAIVRLSIFSTFDFTLLFKLAIIINSSLLVLLVFRDEIVHVGFGFSELHFVHTFTSVPVQESLSPEHSSELFRNALEQFLDSGGITNKCGRHLETTRRNVTHSGLYVIGDPFNEVGRILVLDAVHLIIDLPHRHATTEDRGDGQVATMAGIASGHHILSVEHLLGKFGNGEGTVLLAITSR